MYIINTEDKYYYNSINNYSYYDHYCCILCQWISPLRSVVNKLLICFLFLSLGHF